MQPLPLTEDQVLAAVSIVATPTGAAALLSEWHDRVVTADEVAQCIAASERLRRITAFCRAAQTPTSATDGFEERVKAMAGPRPWRDQRARK